MMFLDVLIMRILRKNSKLQHCARCIYFLSQITTRTSNLKIPYSYVLIDLQSIPPKRPQSNTNDMECVEYRRLHQA